MRLFRRNKQVALAPAKPAPLYVYPVTRGYIGQPINLSSDTVKTTGSPLLDSFMGINGDNGDLPNNDQGWARAYSASPTMFRCIDIRSKTLANIPLRVVDTAGNEVKDHPFAAVTDPRNTLLLYTTENDLQVFGRAFWEFARDRTQPGKAIIKRLNPATIEIIKSPREGIAGYVQRIGGQVINRWRREELVYFSSYNPADDAGYVSPTQHALRSIGVTLSITEYGAYFFENGAIPDGILTTDVKLNDTDRERILENWRRQFQGTENAHGTALLDGPPGARITFQPLSHPIKDLAMPELSESQQREIAKSYGVPPTLAMIENAANYATADAERKSLYNETVIPELDLILDTTNTQLVPHFGLRAQIQSVTDDIDVLQEDRTEITQRASQGVGAGYLSINDARDREHDNPLQTDYFIVGGKLVPRALMESGDFTALRELGVLGQMEAQAVSFPFASLQQPTPQKEEPIIIDSPPQKATVDIVVHAPDREQAEQATKAVMSDTMLKDLERWRRKISNKGVHAPFDPDYLPDGLAAFLRAEVRGWDGETDADTWIDAAFERAKDAVTALYTKQEDATAAPEEFEAFWRGIDGLFDEVGEVFEQQFDGLRQRLVDGLRTASATGVEFDVEKFLEDSAPLIVDALAGSEDAPGVLVNIIQAGAARGNDLAQGAAKQTELTIDWQLINDFALQFARDFAGDLITGINETSLDILRTKIAEWIETGGTLEDLADFIEGVLPDLETPDGWTPGKLEWATSRSRARLIAQTETTRAFTEGNFERWRQIGITKAEWRTQRDSHVDDEICRPLHGVIGSLAEGWVNPKDGRAYRIPAHPGCRCFPRPITGRA